MSENIKITKKDVKKIIVRPSTDKNVKNIKVSVPVSQDIDGGTF